MKHLLPVILFCFSIAGLAQQTPVVTNKYKIILPSYWKAGNKVWEVLTDKLPIICEELKDKQLCGSYCNPDYTVSLEISEPKITDLTTATTFASTENEEYVTKTFYSFKASMLLKNRNGETITKMVLVDTNETFIITHKSVTHAVSSKRVPVITGKNQENAAVWQRVMQNYATNSVTNNASSASSRKNEDYKPDMNELYKIIHSKIMALTE